MVLSEGGKRSMPDPYHTHHAPLHSVSRKLGVSVSVQEGQEPIQKLSLEGLLTHLIAVVMLLEGAEKR